MGALSASADEACALLLVALPVANSLPLSLFFWLFALVSLCSVLSTVWFQSGFLALLQ